ncbi:MAG: SH3 domain-containing protein [Alphaproteobacteria bacterium]|nr:MAG: SH3 domain-containing protein [Alphaproteobacteria bacterium]
MRLRSIPTLAAAVAVLMLAGTAAASAASAYASTTVNVRAGAGSGYPVVDVLRPGERVDVDYCKGAWCAVEKPGPDGWVNANYLSAGRDYDDYDDDDYGYYDEDDGPDFYIRQPRSRVQYWPYYQNRACVGGPNARFCITD